MKSLYIKTLATACLAVAALSASAERYEFTYNTPDAESGLIGFGIADHYDVGMYIPGTGLSESNAKLIEFTIIVPMHENIKNHKMWVSTKLDSPNLGIHFSGNLNNTQVTPVQMENSDFGTITYKLPKEYAITADGVFVGYSFDVSAIDKKNNFTSYPILVSDDATPYGLIARTAMNLPEFEAMGDCSIYCTAVFDGEFTDNTVGMVCDKLYAQKGEPSVLKATVINQGRLAISSLDFTYTVAGITGNGTLNVDIEGISGAEALVRIPLEGIAEAGDYSGEITITNVNGMANPKATPFKFDVTALDKLPVHRPVMEEYTGTNCGYCPRGMAGMQILKDNFEDFIGIAYHGRGDIMTLKSGVPDMATQYPQAYLDRDGISRDPYFGITNIFGHIVQEYTEKAEVFAPADVEVSAAWNDDATTLSLTGEVTFAVIPDDGYNYRLSFVVIEDGLHGKGADWYQLNYLSGDRSNDKYLSIYENDASAIMDMEYNDVAVYAHSARGIANSLPKTNSLEVGTTYSYTLEVPLTEFVTARNQQSYQNKDNMKVVALLVKQDTQNGTIANAAIADVPAATGIDMINDAEVTSIMYYDLMGRQVKNPDHGIFIVNEKLSDGTIRSCKVIR